MQKRNIAGTFDYSYDTNGQLTGVSGAGAENFNYDSIGNRLTDQNGNYNYDQTSQRLMEDWQYTYSYDDNGNLTTKLPKDLNKNAFLYSYSSKNQLVQVRILEKPLGQVIKQIDYVYDVLGRRMQKSITDSLDSSKSYARKFVYDGDNIIAEYDGSNNVLAQYTHSPLAADDILSASISTEGVNAGLSQSAGNIYYMKDALGSVTDVADANGNILQRYNYASFGKIESIKDGFGNDITSSPVVSTSFTYTGRELESEQVGMYYYRARYYDSNIGRFIQEDPDPGKVSNPNTINNKYAYVSNIPTMLIDPSGKIFWWAVVAIVSVLNGLYTGYMNEKEAKSGGYDKDKQNAAFWSGFFSGTLTAAISILNPSLTPYILTLNGAVNNALLQMSTQGEVRNWGVALTAGLVAGIGGYAAGAVGVKGFGVVFQLTKEGAELLSAPIQIGMSHIFTSPMPSGVDQNQNCTAPNCMSYSPDKN